MENSLYTRSFQTFLLMAVAETFAGTFRELVLTPRLDKRTVHYLGTAIACTNVVAIGTYMLPWIHPRSNEDLTKIGITWYGSMIAFDVLLGKLGRNLSWKEVFNSFNPFQGGCLGIEMSIMLFAPFLGDYYYRHFA